ncbi:pseudouridine synthase, RluA family [Gottschalkia purinilytica]|uniref:Pseudouridine synthase n=1 Tax=Gottschalkia purinilytica TaxID=1503 RepID=A0A0L0WDF4_GOTPU|nr:RluA family pseudouridine synthase [Gottschalkia purinilytica]KNF09508.1 pseudouridine synthase, RluA family [Gottschalkia purinilytica]
MKNFEENESIVSFKVEDDELTVERTLKKRFDVSSRLFRKLVKTKCVFLNNRKVNRNETVKKGDIITIIMEDEKDSNIPQNDIPIDIIYEDYDLVIINKQPNMVVHPTKGHPYGTIANALAYYFKEKNIKKKVRFVNRLDRDTSGVLVIAKNSFAHQQLSKQFQDDLVEKTYLTLVKGIVKEENGTIDMPIERDEEDSIKRVVREDGKRCITHYKVIERYKNSTLLEVKIETGRTHQIRVHLSYIGYPIIGDPLYNNSSELINRQALHSYSLKFNLLRTNKRIEVKAELPKDIQKVIELGKKECIE